MLDFSFVSAATIIISIDFLLQQNTIINVFYALKTLEIILSLSFDRIPKTYFLFTLNNDSIGNTLFTVTLRRGFHLRLFLRYNTCVDFVIELILKRTVFL